MARSERGRRLLKTLFGYTDGKTIVLILAGLVLMSSFADGLFSLAAGGLQGWIGDRPGMAAATGLSLLLLLALVWVAKRRGERLTQRERVRPDSEEPPRRARGLICYLSNFGPPDQADGRRRAVESFLAEAGPGEDPHAYLDDKHPWLMPVKGLGRHAGALQRVVVIPSRDEGSQEGTWRRMDLFTRFLQHCFPGLEGRVTAVGALLNEERWQEGVSYVDLQALIEATDRAFEHLAQEIPGSHREGRVLVDVTSGSRETGIAGTLVTLARNRRFQHVNTANQEVRTFDIEYAAEDA